MNAKIDAPRADDLSAEPPPGYWRLVARLEARLALGAERTVAAGQMRTTTEAHPWVHIETTDDPSIFRARGSIGSRPEGGSEADIVWVPDDRLSADAIVARWPIAFPNSDEVRTFHQGAYGA
jgi:hypothetical protein